MNEDVEELLQRHGILGIRSTEEGEILIGFADEGKDLMVRKEWEDEEEVHMELVDRDWV